jgi:hypothetical protein
MSGARPAAARPWDPPAWHCRPADVEAKVFAGRGAWAHAFGFTCSSFIFSASGRPNSRRSWSNMPSTVAPATPWPETRKKPLPLQAAPSAAAAAASSPAERSMTGMAAGWRGQGCGTALQVWAQRLRRKVHVARALGVHGGMAGTASVSAAGVPQRAGSAWAVCGRRVHFWHAHRHKALPGGTISNAQLSECAETVESDRGRSFGRSGVGKWVCGDVMRLLLCRSNCKWPAQRLFYSTCAGVTRPRHRSVAAD